MPKSKLSTAQIRDLKDQGVSTAEIARRAGTTAQNVKRRLAPEPKRKRDREHYQLASDEERQEYSDVVLQRTHELQDETEEHATRVGLPWTAEEIEFLKREGPTVTVVKLALELSRTYAGVRRAAQRYGIRLGN